jgi:hypothetical protein
LLVSLVEKARVLDKAFIGYVRALDPQGLHRALCCGECEACGGGPTVAAMLASRGLGPNRASILHYADSGDVTGDRREVVGYLSALFLEK